MQSPGVQDMIDNRIGHAPQKCAAKTSPVAWASGSVPILGASTGESPGMSFTVATGLFMGVAILGISMCCSCSAFKAWILGSPTEIKATEDSTDKPAVDALVESTIDGIAAGNHALVCTNSIPCCCRLTIVFSWLVVCALFFFGHVLLAISIDVKLQLVTLNLSFEGFEKLNILRAINEMLNGKVYFLAVVIILVSLVWPYIRTLGMLSLWLVPPRVISAQRRGSLLVWLDFLAKWSMFDIYTLIVFLLAMNLNITSPKRLFILPEGLYNVELILSPQMGLYSNLLAQVVSQIVSHVQIHYHRKVMDEVAVAVALQGVSKTDAVHERGQPVLLGRLKPVVRKSLDKKPADMDLESPAAKDVNIESIMDLKPCPGDADDVDLESPSCTHVSVHKADESPCRHQSVMPLESASPSAVKPASSSVAPSVCSHTCELLAAKGSSSRLTMLVQVLVPSFLVLGNLMLLIGSVLPIMSVTTSGMVGILLDFGEAEARTQTFSVLQMTEVLANQLKASMVNEVGIWSLTIIFVVCTVVMPVVQALVWAVMWLRPLSLERLKGLVVLSEILSAWSFFEVFMIAILIASMQLERLAFGLLDTLRTGVGDSQFIIISQIVDALREIGVIDSSDAAIFQLSSELHAGAYVLLVSAALLGCSGLFINGHAASFVRLRKEESLRTEESQ